MRAKIIEDNKLSKQEFLNSVRKDQNFFKHADNDPNGTIHFNLHDTEELIFISSLNWGNLHSIKPSLSIELSVFQFWYIAAHRIGTKFDNRLIENSNEVFPNLNNLTREKQLLKGRDYLLKFMSIKHSN